MLRKKMWKIPIYVITGIVSVALVTYWLVPRPMPLYQLWNAITMQPGIREFALQDALDVKRIFEDDWHLLISDYSQEHGFDLDYMFKQKKVPGYHPGISPLANYSYIQDGKVVGFSSVYLKSKTVGHILFIVVDKEYRGKGIARKLVSHALQQLFAQGVQRVTLDTREGNKVARAMYKKLGFTLIDNDNGYVKYAFYKNQPLP